ncbi:MAG: hypothetical protein KC621_06040 [Myxococcales bacterium]|nr:hypothetical protein [Myxococcales bacterium]
MRRVLPLLAIAACSYEPPLDDGATRPLNAIHGEVVFGGGPDVATTYVTLFDAAAPPPPTGLGSPVTFTSVAASAFTDGGATLRSAPFHLTRIEDGDYVLGAITDLDGDFHPLASVLAGATCGDWSGAHLASLATTSFGTIEVQGGRRVDDVTILVGAPLTTERPAFEVLTGPVAIAALAAPYPATMRLSAIQVDTAFSDDLQLHLGPECAPEAIPDCDATLPACPCAADTPPCSTALWVWMNDADGDGALDPYPAEPQASSGLFDVWPRTYLEYGGDLETFEFEGRELPERWVSEAYPLAFEILGTLAMGGDPSLLGPIGVPFPAHSLSVTLSSTFVHYHADGQMGVDENGPFDLVDVHDPAAAALVPDGAWGVTLVSFTGQTWTVPNEIAGLGLPSLDPAFDPATQGVPLVLTR